MPLSKASFDKETQKARIANHSIFGFWCDFDNLIHLRISPFESSVRIKLVQIVNKGAMERISGYCCLKFPPRRIRWKGFDFITGLVKENEHYYNHGVVHVPNATRKMLADIKVLDNSRIFLDFYFIDSSDNVVKRKYTGTFSLRKRLN